MSEPRFGDGTVTAFAGFAPSAGARRKKVLISKWQPYRGAEEVAIQGGVIACEAASLPMRLRSAQIFEYLGAHYYIYLDLLFVGKRYELCRFINGPLCTRHYVQLGKATRQLGEQTQCRDVAWLRCAPQLGWVPFDRKAAWHNRLSLEQAQALQRGERLGAVEQLLAVAPTPRQLAALPLDARPHWRNLARRLLCAAPRTTLAQLGWRAEGKEAQRFAAAFRREACAAALQRGGVCALCELRPIALAYACAHQITCAGCARWKTCIVCAEQPAASACDAASQDLALEWFDCLLPKPALLPPRLADFLHEWLVVDWDGEVLERLAPPAEAQRSLAVRQLAQRHARLGMSDDLLDLLMDE